MARFASRFRAGRPCAAFRSWPGWRRACRLAAGRRQGRIEEQTRRGVSGGSALGRSCCAGFWVAAGQIIGINIVLSGDNAVVIALACRMLPPRQRFWGMILGAGVAVLLRIFSPSSSRRRWVPVPQAGRRRAAALGRGQAGRAEEDGGEGKVAAADNLWRAVRIVAIADIVMSLDNVIAIAAAAETAAVRVDLGARGRHQDDLDHLRSCDQHSADHRGQRAADGVARSLSDPGLGRRRVARLGRRRHHDQGRRVAGVVRPAIRRTRRTIARRRLVSGAAATSM